MLPKLNYGILSENNNLGILIEEGGGFTPPPVSTGEFVTEGGDPLVTEGGDALEIE